MAGQLHILYFIFGFSFLIGLINGQTCKITDLVNGVLPACDSQGGTLLSKCCRWNQRTGDLDSMCCPKDQCQAKPKFDVATCTLPTCLDMSAKDKCDTAFYKEMNKQLPAGIDTVEECCVRIRRYGNTVRSCCIVVKGEPECDTSLAKYVQCGNGYKFEN